jgi:hypothetical protein
MAKKPRNSKKTPAKAGKQNDQKGNEQKMPAEQDQKAEAPAAAAPAAGRNIGVRLVPSGNTDLPIVSNFTRVQLSSVGVLVDFGFLEPVALDALARTARAGGKIPETISGRLASRFALAPDVVAMLYQQLGQAISALQKSTITKKDS